MSRIGSDPFANASINPLYTGASSTARATQAATATVGGHTLQLAETAEAPPPRSGIGDKIKAFFKSIGDAFSKLGDKIMGHQPAKDVADIVFKTPDKQFDAGVLSSKDRFAGSYAFVKDQADGANTANIGAFMRGNTNGSKMTTHAGDKPQTVALMRDVKTMIGDSTIAIDKKSYGVEHDGSIKPDISPFASIKSLDAGAIDSHAIAQASVDKIDDIMCRLFGTPGDQASIDKAASRFPKDLCNQLATLHRAVDDSAAPADLKDGMKLHLARDAFALRSVNPAITKVVAEASQEVSDRGDGSVSLLQVSKAVQSLVNGAGMGTKDTHADVQAAGAHMQTRWNDAFADFVDAMVARADTKVVAAAQTKGAEILDLK